MRVYKLHLRGSDTPVFDDLEDVVLEIRELLPEMQSDDVLEIRMDEMTREEIDALEEFRGY